MLESDYDRPAVTVKRSSSVDQLLLVFDGRSIENLKLCRVAILHWGNFGVICGPDLVIVTDIVI